MAGGTSTGRIAARVSRGLALATAIGVLGGNVYRAATQSITWDFGGHSGRFL